tara:strand:+ start:1023 stop:1229 length:207 start_codon:yes stop_codon:yes gene_type:complete
MQIISIGSFYLGIEKDKYCDLSLHLGRLNVEYSCPSIKQSNDESRPVKGGDGLRDGETSSSNRAIPQD